MKNWLKDAWTRFKADIKKAHKSLVIWFNALVAAASVGLPAAESSFTKLQAYLPHNTYHWLLGAVIVGNIILRFRTSTPLSAK